MKRIVDSTKTIKNCVVGNSKSREFYCAGKYKHERCIFEPYRNFLSLPRRSLSVGSTKFEDNDFGKVHPLPERLCMYWSLDEDNKRKVSDPAYVKQAVRETFMQRAHGAYHYRRSPHFPVHTSVSHKTTYAPSEKQAASKTPKPKPAKPPPEKHIPKPEAPKRKRFIDTAQPVRHFVSKARVLQDRARLGAELRESSEAQLEAMRKKLYDPKPAVLEYLMEKHSPKLSGYQLKTRKEKYLADTTEPLPPFVQRVFGWRKDSKKNVKEQEDSGDDNISITPRAIEVKKSSGKRLSLKRSRRPEESAELSEDAKSEKRKSKLKSSNEKKSITNEERRARRRDAQEKEDREAIINKIRSVSSAHRAHHEYRSIKSQVRDMDLSPQIYPRGSLSLRKSYLPISPCRQVVSNNSSSPMAPKVVVPKLAEFTPPSDAKPKSADGYSFKSFTGSLVDSFKNLLHKIRRRNSD